MGLFSALDRSNINIDFRDDMHAKATLITAMSALDGEISKDEIDIAPIVKALCVGLDNTDQAKDHFKSLRETYSTPEIIAAAFSYIEPEAHRTVFFAACMVTMADGFVDFDEQEALFDMATLSPALSDDIASQIVGVAGMLIKEKKHQQQKQA
ncbi:TerB family tellurite resistance protein [Cohaesibacter sp. CAU 1516]|uniref:tellurite resistance TerB family protein n=1 Tax=Cohaesibacter sp. CAU 1516 TaxID=2576038 RepID=UPI0010FDEC36|nr:TerB family tellurite resistance protein [Cohaesibacter sp. CAU 1516]TLP48752.1 TerB family tellurite resistance protein [Cohaesibacter sp. CAU 1516]